MARGLIRMRSFLMGTRTWGPARCSTSTCGHYSLKALIGPPLPSALPFPTLSCAPRVRLAAWFSAPSAGVGPP
eukprot:7872101-Alexandrium_andersonii.AAC.1